MKTKYDWSHIPPHINFIVTDVIGRKLGFINKPESVNDYCIMKADYLASEYILKIDNWQDSLEERPNESN